MDEHLCDVWKLILSFGFLAIVWESIKREAVVKTWNKYVLLMNTHRLICCKHIIRFKPIQNKSVINKHQF